MNEPISGEKAAFPWPKDQNQHLFSLGVNLRDYFAAAALQGNLASQSIDVGYYDGEDSWNKAATDAYKAADAMLKARDAK